MTAVETPEAEVEAGPVEPAIVVSHVSKRFRIYRNRETTLKQTVLSGRRGVYEEFTAVDDISFEVPTGQALGIFGRNGSGKSTMLKMLARILAPDGGSIEVKGRVAALLEVGAGFHPEYSAIENIFLSGAIYGMSREELAPRVDEIIAFAQLERFAHNPVKTYSSGMYARLGFSIAVNVDPDVLLVDEVLAVGDESFRSRCYERMLAFREAGKTLILVTHDLGAIASFCERAIWLDEGKVRGEGTPEAITRRYVAEVTAQEELWSAQQAAAGRGLVTFHQPINETVPITLSSMSISADDGTERDVFHNGEAIHVRVHYIAQKPVRSPIVEIALHRHDGTHVTTASTRTGDFDPGDVLEGEGFMEWAIEDLRLTPGSYYLSPKLIDQTGLHVLDEQDRWYRFTVREGQYHETGGTVILPATWGHQRTREGLAAAPEAPAPLPAREDPREPPATIEQRAAPPPEPTAPGRDVRELAAAHRDRLVAALALAALTAFVVVLNLLWVRAHREGLPFDIDESGYLQRAMRDGDALGHGGLSGIWDAFRLKDPQAPMLPIAAGIWHQISNAGPVGLIAGEQIFVIIALISTFLIARRLDGRLVPALIAAGCVAALPGVVDGGRSFTFALPATAFMTAALASQLAAGDFKRLRPALVWGVMLGLGTLTRTVMLALLPALLLALLIRLVLLHAGRRQWLNAVAGGVVGLLVAATWYTATYHLVWDYLTSYGYGQQANSYGSSRGVLSSDWWTYRIVRAADTEIYLPLSIAGLVCLVVVASRAFAQQLAWVRDTRGIAFRFLTSGWGTMTFVLVFDYLVLSSTHNKGSSFELPLLPAATALLVSGASLGGRGRRRVALGVATIAAAFSIVAAQGWLPGHAKRDNVAIGPVAYDPV